MHTIYQFYEFLKYPYRINHEATTIDVAIKQIGILFLLSYGILMFVAGPLLVLSGVNDMDHKIAEMGDSMNAMAMFFIAVIVAPFFEEIFFRLPLKYKSGARWLSLILLSGATYFIAAQSISTFWIPLAISLGMFVIGFLVTAGRDTAWREAKWFPYYYYFVAMMFAYMHIFNFELDPNKWYLTPILVLPQFSIGLILGYVRLRYGIVAAILFHATNNMIPMAGLLLSNQ